MKAFGVEFQPTRLGLLLLGNVFAFLPNASATFKICGRPFVNSTVPERTIAEIHSPGYPSGYLGPHDCTLTVVVPEFSWIGFYSILFEMPKKETECIDYLTIENPSYPSKRMTRCGNASAHELLFYESSFYSLENINIRFHAEAYTTNTEQEKNPQKFVVEYVVADVIYPGTNYNHSKAVVSHGYGYIISHSAYTGKRYTNHYSDNINSHFILTGLQPGLVMEFHFLSFQLHNDLNCSDYLNITGISEDNFVSEPLILCGNEAHNTAYVVTTVGDTIKFHFKTGPKSTNPGFKIQYYIQGTVGSFTSSTEYSTDQTTKDSEPSTVTTNASGRRKTKAKGTRRNLQDNQVTEGPSGTDYVYLGVGIGVGNLLLAILVITVIVVIVRRKKRLSRQSDSSYSSTNSSQRPPGSDGRGMTTTNAADTYDDESAYYSEIGTFRKPHSDDKNDMGLHYASRTVCGNNFYHIVEEPRSTEPAVNNNLPLLPTNSTQAPSSEQGYQEIAPRPEPSAYSQNLPYPERPPYPDLQRHVDQHRQVNMSDQADNTPFPDPPDYIMQQSTSNYRAYPSNRPLYAEQKPYASTHPYPDQQLSYPNLPQHDVHNSGFSQNPERLNADVGIEYQHYSWRANHATERF